ncbi:MAG: hypothetical protein P8R42_17145 [Candidatus Binatia bacterium]|nr:hypothetical protein [Candidatus Binatia bacterium]
MDPDRILRTALWVTAVFNVVFALVASMPDSVLGQVAGLPGGVPAVYAILLAWTIALFGLLYGWLAQQAEIQRPLVAFGALGKGGVVAIVCALCVGGSVPGQIAFLASGNLFFAGLFVWWLRANAGAAVSPGISSQGLARPCRSWQQKGGAVCER